MNSKYKTKIRVNIQTLSVVNVCVQFDFKKIEEIRFFQLYSVQEKIQKN